MSQPVRQLRSSAAAAAVAVAMPSPAMRAEGASLREIAAAAGLTHTAVRKVLARSQLAA